MEDLSFEVFLFREASGRKEGEGLNGLTAKSKELAREGSHVGEHERVCHGEEGESHKKSNHSLHGRILFRGS